MPSPPPSARPPAPAHDWGRLVAGMLCAVFGLLGALPLSAGFIGQSAPAQRWAAQQTAQFLARTLELRASYNVKLDLMPLELTLSNLRVESTDGAGPALTVREIIVSPRVFSLIAGRLDVGDVQIEEPHARLVLKEGKIQNAHFKLPSGGGAELEQAPFSSLSITDGVFVVDVDGHKIETGTLDADVFVERDDTWEVALRLNESRITLDEGTYPKAKDPENGRRMWEEDVLCQLDARIQVTTDEVLLRRLSLIGTADVDPAKGTPASCRVKNDNGEMPEGRVAIRAHGLVIGGIGTATPTLKGNALARIPLGLVNRFTPDGSLVNGWVTLNGDLNLEGQTTLPDLQGTIKTGKLTYGEFTLLEGLEGPIEILSDRIFSPELKIGYGGGSVRAQQFTIEPFEEGVPLNTQRVHIKAVPFEHLMRDVDVTPNAIVTFLIDNTTVDHFGGTLSPLVLDGEMNAQAARFEIFDRSYRSPERKHMFGANSTISVRGSFGVRDDGLLFDDEVVSFGQSRLEASVHVGFSNWIEMEVGKSQLELSDVSPLVNVPMSGMATLSAKMGGPRDDPTLNSQIQVENLVFGGFELGHLTAADVKFRPLFLEVTRAQLKKGSSFFGLPTARFDFETDAAVQVDASLTTEQAGIRDFLALWGFEKDPRWTDLAGRVKSKGQVRYLLGGPRDPCDTGVLSVSADANFTELAAFGENYDRAHAAFTMKWSDIDAGYLGMSLHSPGFKLEKGTGNILGSVDLLPGGHIRANAVGTALPLSRIDGLGDFGKSLAGTIGAVGSVGGTLDEMTASAQVRISPVTIGRSALPPSKLQLQLVPTTSSARFSPGRTKCGRPIPAAFDPVQYAKDKPNGHYHLQGKLFGGQLEILQATVSRQDKKVGRGSFRLNRLALAPVFELSDAVTATKDKPRGTLSGDLEIKHWPLDDLTTIETEADVEELSMDWKGFHFEANSKPEISSKDRRVVISPVQVAVTSPSGQKTRFETSGSVSEMGKAPVLDLLLNLSPVELSSFKQLFQRDQRVGGTLEGNVHLSGPLTKLKQKGRFQLRGGHIGVPGSNLRLTNADVVVVLDESKLEVVQAKGSLAGGSVSASGVAPLSGLRLGEFRSQIVLENVALPLGTDVHSVADARLDATWFPPNDDGTTQRLPKITGLVMLNSFEYARPVTMNADITTLAGRGRTKFDSYDPSEDKLELDVLVNANGPLRLNNNLIDAELSINAPGLQLTGTNQRYGLRGRIEINNGGRIRLRRNQFEVQSGEVRFEDATHIAPRVDVTAFTDYRRFSSTTSTGSTGTSGAGASALGSTAGQWRIRMHAYGDTENLKLDLSSQPKLSQDDIFLLLTLGLTRAELDQAQSAQLGGSVALEALGSLTGADSAVTDAIPVIDEFRFGSAYSASTGRTEPTVTIGKRLTKRIRAYVTSGLSESREVRSNLEWRLNSKMSVEGSYDNINAISSSNLGNVGADIRWRVEFK